MLKTTVPLVEPPRLTVPIEPLTVCAFVSTDPNAKKIKNKNMPDKSFFIIFLCR
jgi:hypothetical protein